MPTAARITVLFPMLLVISCAGGGGSVHVPPDSIVYGQVTTLHLELSVWGNSSSKMSTRNTDAVCHYKTEKSETFTALQGTITSETTDRMVIDFDLPAFSAIDGSYVEYAFEMKLDGHSNKREKVRVPFRS